MILGNGSNLLVRDSGFPGVVIQLGRNFSKIECKDNLFIAQAGALMPAAAKRALKEGLTGFEFASGISLQEMCYDSAFAVPGFCIYQRRENYGRLGRE